MIKELLFFFLSLDQMAYALFVPALVIGFLAGTITLIKGVGRWT